MLDERLEKLSRIGDAKGISFVMDWLTAGIRSIRTIQEYTSSSAGIYRSEIYPICILLSSMGVISIKDDEIMCLIDIPEHDHEQWFIRRYINFILENGLININEITFSISENRFIMSYCAISPSRYASYRNLLIDCDLISMTETSKYVISPALSAAIQGHLRSNKISALQLDAQLKREREMGEAGELFALEYERNRLSNEKLKKDIQRISDIDVSAGFDIVSFNSNASIKQDRFIEVKCYTGVPHFHWSRNEIEKAKLMGDAYYLYIVEWTSIKKPGYVPTIICNPYEALSDRESWLLTPDSYLVEEINL